MRPTSAFTVLAAALCLTALAATARAESVVSLRNGDKLAGPVPAGEVIRVKMFMVQGSQPELKLTLSGFRGAISFTSGSVDVPVTELFPPDDEGNEQNETTLATGSYVTDQLVREHRFSRFKLLGFDPVAYPAGAPKTGWYQLLIRTNNRTKSSTANGRYKSKRASKVILFGDETNNLLNVELVQGDRIKKFIVKRIGRGTAAPELEEVRFPIGVSGKPSQKQTKKGSKTLLPITVSPATGNFGTGEGTFTYVIGYQDPAATAGPFKATLRIRPRKSGATMQIQIKNAPDIPLSVRPVPERFAKVNELGSPNWIDAGSDVGLADDGELLYVSGEKGGQLLVRRVTRDLTVQNRDFATAWVVADETADFPQGEFLSGHRMIRAGDHFFAVASSASGNYGRLYKFEVRHDDISNTTTFLVNLTREILAVGSETTTDMFLTSDATTVSVGLFAGSPSVSHHVYRFDQATLDPSGPNPQTIGLPSEGAAHTSAAGASFREIVDVAEQPYYELWAPDSLNPLGPESNLHRQTYAIDWSSMTAPDRVYGFDYDDDGMLDPKVEQSATAVNIDDQLGGGVQATGVTILHYIVPVGGTAFGDIHRRTFDMAGNEIRDSHFVLEITGLRRADQPVAIIVNETSVRSHVYVAYTTAEGPEIQRFPIVR